MKFINVLVTSQFLLKFVRTSVHTCHGIKGMETSSLLQLLRNM